MTTNSLCTKGFSVVEELEWAVLANLQRAVRFAAIHTAKSILWRTGMNQPFLIHPSPFSLGPTPILQKAFTGNL